MLQGWIIVFTSFAYLGLLFAIAYYADMRADAGRSVISSPYIYSLSLAVYATAWTFYGSVGRAASDGIGFLPIYIGPTLMIALWWVVMRKILRISKQNRITSLADFIASRYGKSALLGGAAVGIYVTFVIYEGFGDVFSHAAAHGDLVPMLTPLSGLSGNYASWVWLTILSMAAIMFLPRQFQVAVIENKDERQLNKAIWLFPLYMLAINVFVLPIAFGGRMHFPAGIRRAHHHVLTLPMAEKEWRRSPVVV